MDAFSSLVSDVYGPISDSLNARGGEVSDLALSLINRSRAYLWGYAPWDLFRKEESIAVDGTTKIASLPAACGRILKVTYSEDIDFPCFEENSCDENFRYKLVSTASTTTGFTISLQFYGTVISTTAWLRYMQKITSCTLQTDYLLFPAELVLRTARWLRTVDKHANVNDVNIEENALKKNIDNYRQFYHCNDRQRRPFQRDWYGNELINSSLNLLGDE